MSTYTVTAPLVIAKSESGADLYVYQGGVVPAGQSEEWLATHLAAEMIVEGDAPAEPAPEPDPAPDPDARPAGNASADEWRAYAVARGMSQEEADGLGRDELRDRFTE